MGSLLYKRGLVVKNQKEKIGLVLLVLENTVQDIKTSKCIYYHDFNSEFDIYGKIHYNKLKEKIYRII